MDDPEKRDFQSIGSLTRKIVDMRSAKDTTTPGSMSKPLPAETGTSCTKSSIATITPIGGHGSATQKSSGVREVMALLDPAKTLAAIRVSLPLSVSSSLRRKDGGYRIDPVYGYTPFPSRGFEEIVAPQGDISLALAIVEEALRPVDSKTLLAEIGTMKLTTISRSNNDSEMELVLRAYARELGRYPHDIVLSVIRKRARTEKWWPALAELLEPIEELMVDRIELRDALLTATSADD